MPRYAFGTIDGEGANLYCVLEAASLKEAEKVVKADFADLQLRTALRDDEEDTAFEILVRVGEDFPLDATGMRNSDTHDDDESQLYVSMRDREEEDEDD